MSLVQWASCVQYRTVRPHLPNDPWLTHECPAEHVLRHDLSVGDASSIAEGVVQCIGVQNDGVVQVRAVNTRLNRRNKNCVSTMSTTAHFITSDLSYTTPTYTRISELTDAKLQNDKADMNL